MNKALSSRFLIHAALISLTFAGAFLINGAHAAGGITRASCFARGTAADMGRQMGVRNSNRLVNALWNRLGRRCDQVDRLAQIIADTPFSRPTTGGAFAACFYMGYTDTIWDQLDLIYERCGLRCFNAGAEIGRISAEGYCAASLAVGGLYDPGFIEQPPLPFCGQNLVLGCKVEYVQVASFEYPGCYAFTEGDFALTFDNSVRQDCFVPSDVPIRDFGAMSTSIDDFGML